MMASLWKLYACVLCTIFVLMVWRSDLDVMSIIVLLLTLINLIGLCGFAFNTAIFCGLVWKLYFVILISIICCFITIGWSIEAGYFDAILALMLDKVVVTQLPLMYALWAYGYRSKALWK